MEWKEGQLYYIQDSQVHSYSTKEESELTFRRKIFELEATVTGTYTGAKVAVEVSCNVEGHPAFMVKPYSVYNTIRPRWCKHCLAPDQTKRRTFEEARDYFYSELTDQGEEALTEYNGSHGLVLVRCINQHVRETTPNRVVSDKSRCPQCFNTAEIGEERYRTEVVRRGGLVLGEYINSATPILTQCSCGYQWRPLPNTVSSGEWCPFCGHGSDVFLEKLRQKLIYRNGYTLSNYINNVTPMIFVCNKSHQWETRPVNIVQFDTWCPMCSQSKGEFAVSKALTSMGIQFTPQGKYQIGNSTHIFDFVVQLTINDCTVWLFIEYDGRQHHEEVEFFKRTLAEQQERDNVKNVAVTSGGHHMLRIPYWDYKRVSEIITATIQRIHSDSTKLIQFDN